MVETTCLTHLLSAVLMSRAVGAVGAMRKVSG